MAWLPASRAAQVDMLRTLSLASDVITLACLPNGLLASSSGDSTIQFWDPARPDAARWCSPTRFLQRAALEDAGLHEADKPDIQRDLMGTVVDTVRVMA
jgi:hypothetical protein